MGPSKAKAGYLDWLAGGATLLAVVSCYGPLILAGALSLLGVTLSIHSGAWAGTVLIFVLAALAGVLHGYRRHRILGPVALALAGTGLIAWVMLAEYNWVAELAGFAALASAAAWNWRLRSPQHQQEVQNAGHQA